MRQIVTVSNVNSLEFTALVELLQPIYCKEIPEIGISSPINLKELEVLMIFFSNQYAYMAELWATALHEVRMLKRLKSPKESVDVSMDKRDYLEKVMSTCKLKYFAASRLLMYHSKQGGD